LSKVDSLERLNPTCSGLVRFAVNKKKLCSGTLHSFSKILFHFDLAEGNIVPIERHNTDSVRIEDILFELTQKLLNTDGLTIDDKPATKEDVYLIISTLDTAMEIRKRQQERLAAYYNNLLKEG
jgi:hypothetical protein